MTDAAARVIVDDVHQLPNGTLAVTDNMPRHSLCGGNQFPIDDQQAMVESFHESFHNDAATVLACFFERRFDFLFRFQVNRYAATVIAGQRFKDDRVTDAFRGSFCIARRTHDVLFWYR